MDTENDVRLQSLFERYIQKTCTPEEQAEFEVLLGQETSETKVKALIANMIGQYSGERPMGEESSKAILQAIFLSDKKPTGIADLNRLNSWNRMNPGSIWNSWKKWTVAAAVFIMMLCTGTYFIIYYKSQSVIADTQHKGQDTENDIAPGSNGAELTLADGSRIALDSAGNGIVASQGSTRLVKQNNGQLNYEAREKNKEILYNTLSTNRGKQFIVTLPDGSRVWLNAASSLHYPTAFTGRERSVDVQGEAYFEIAQDASNPFKVRVNGMEVQVLGTHFNINAYEDEASVNTTLLEGSVRVMKGANTVLIKPGQQARLNRSAGMDIVKQIEIINDADIEQVIAWKNGFTAFKSADLRAIMRQISRWYDVDVVYEGNIPERNFTGEVYRSSNLSKLLEILTASDIHFRIEGKKLTVMP